MTEPWVELLEVPISLESVRNAVHGDARFGAVVTFEGITRGELDSVHGTLLCLDYEAYVPMALEHLRQIAKESSARWALGRVVILHRLGRVPPAEVSVVIAVTAGHRGAAFEACQWLIETLKRETPIWKKDVFADGHVRWVEGNTCRHTQE